MVYHKYGLLYNFQKYRLYQVKMVLQEIRNLELNLKSYVIEV